MSREGGPPTDFGRYVKWGSCAVGGFTSWALSVFTVQGFLAALYLAPTEEGMWWPAGTRAVWWVLFYVITTGWVQRLMWREAVLSFHSVAQLWAASHVDLVKRLARRVRWWAAGVRVAIEQRRRHRAPAVAAATVPDRSRTVPVERPAGTAAAA